VLVFDESAPRNSRVMGKVIKTVPDKFGLIRQVCIKTKTSTLDRPITKLCLLHEAKRGKSNSSNRIEDFLTQKVFNFESDMKGEKMVPSDCEVL